MASTVRRHELVGAALERIVHGERLGVGERQILHHDDARDAAAGSIQKKVLLMPPQLRLPGERLPGT